MSHPTFMERAAERVVQSPAGFGIAYVLFKSITVESMRNIECAFGIFAIAAGMWMGWPFHMEYKTDNAIYTALATHLPYWSWSILFFGVGFPAFIGCDKKRGIFSRVCVPKRVRIFCAFMALMLWTFISCVFIYDHSPGLSTIWGPIIAVYQLRVLLWLWVNNDSSTPEACSNH